MNKYNKKMPQQQFARILLYKCIKASPFTSTTYFSHLREIRGEKRRKHRICVKKCKQHVWKELDGRVHKRRGQLPHQWFICKICKKKQRRNIKKRIKICIY